MNATEYVRKPLAVVVFAPVFLCLVPVAFAADGPEGVRNVWEGYVAFVQGSQR